MFVVLYSVFLWGFSFFLKKKDGLHLWWWPAGECSVPGWCFLTPFTFTFRLFNSLLRPRAMRKNVFCWTPSYMNTQQPRQHSKLKIITCNSGTGSRKFRPCSWFLVQLRISDGGTCGVHHRHDYPAPAMGWRFSQKELLVGYDAAPWPGHCSYKLCLFNGSLI